MLYIILSIVALYIQHLTLPPPTVQRVEMPIKCIMFISSGFYYLIDLSH